MVSYALKDKTILVTGGGTGIGYGCTSLLLQEGAKVTIAGRRDEVLQEALERLKKEVKGAQVQAITCDITDEEQVKAAIEFATDGASLDVLVANAGSGAPGPILELDADAWRYCCDLNVTGSALCIKWAAKSMQKAQSGSIITISSTAGTKVEKFMAPYSSSKAALEMLTRCAAVELAPFKIRVNCIQPGYVITESTRDFFADSLKESCLTHTPLGRAGLPEDIANGVIYLASSMSEWVTGQVFGIDGGMNVPIGEDFTSMVRSLYGDAVTDAALNK